MVCGLSLLGDSVKVGRGRRQAIGTQNAGNASLVLLEVAGKTTLLALRLDRNNLLGTSLAELQDVVLGRSLATDGQERHGVGLGDGAECRVVPPGVALPVRVVGDVTGGKGDGVVVSERRVRARGGQAELRVQRDTGGSVRVNREGAADPVPDTLGLESVFL